VAVFDPEMQHFFADVTKAPKWKWEKDVAAQRAAKQLIPEMAGEEQPITFEQGLDLFPGDGIEDIQLNIASGFSVARRLLT
jgi:hypothetical protein